MDSRVGTVLHPAHWLQALAHLLAIGTLAHAVLFGSCLAWAVWNFIASRKRDRAHGVPYPPGRAGATVLTVAAGLVAWAVFALLLHGWLIGVKPFG